MRRAAVVLLALAGCGDGADSLCEACEDAAVVGPDASLCHSAPAGSPGGELVVVSHPYDAAGDPASTYQVLRLDDSGALTDTATTFEMGRSLGGEIAFTPDGAVGLLAQEDGTLGVFQLDSAGAVVVVHPSFAGSFYATSVVVDPRGDVAYVIDTNWRNNGGGIYRVAIACDGTLTDLGLWLPAKLPAGLHVRGDRAVLVATDVAASPAGDDAHLLDWTADPPALIGGDDGFGDDDAIVASSAITADGEHLLIGDNSAFAGVPNRVAVMGLGSDALTAVQVLTPIEDPMAVLPSPHGDVALVVSGFGDAIFVLDREASETTPFSVRGELIYQGASPQLPGASVLVPRAALRGLALITENQGIRTVMMAGGGVVTDRGLHELGNGLDAITGAIGVQP